MGCVAGKMSVNAQTKQGKHAGRKTSPLHSVVHFLCLKPLLIVYLQLVFCLCGLGKQTNREGEKETFSGGKQELRQTTKDNEPQ